MNRESLLGTLPFAFGVAVLGFLAAGVVALYPPSDPVEIDIGPYVEPLTNHQSPSIIQAELPTLITPAPATTPAASP